MDDNAKYQKIDLHAFSDPSTFNDTINSLNK